MGNLHRLSIKMTECHQNERVRFRCYCLVALLAAAFVFGLLSSVVVFAQDDVIRVETELVAFEVTVSDAAGNPVKGLNAEDFTVLEDGRERTPDFFQPIVRSGSGRPLSIVFALDVSGSMTEKELVDLKEAMERFVGKRYKPGEPGMEAGIGELMPFLPQRRDQRLADEARREDGMDVGRAPGEGGIELTKGTGRLRLRGAECFEIRQGGRFGDLEAKTCMRRGHKI